MKILLTLALAASLSACAAFDAHVPTEASIAKAADRAVKAESGYSVAAELAVFGAPALDANARARLAKGDITAFAALEATRTTYPLALTLAPADAVRLGTAIDRSDKAHAALQGALAPAGGTLIP